MYFLIWLSLAAVLFNTAGYMIMKGMFDKTPLVGLDWRGKLDRFPCWFWTIVATLASPISYPFVVPYLIYIYTIYKKDM